MKDASAPAFPCYLDVHPVNGLTKRELFAAMAMQGLLANTGASWPAYIEKTSDRAVEMADGLLARLERES